MYVSFTIAHNLPQKRAELLENNDCSTKSTLTDAQSRATMRNKQHQRLWFKDEIIAISSVSRAFTE